LKKIFIILAVALFFCIQIAEAQEASPRVIMETNYGTIVLELYRQKAPKTVENFLGYVRDSFYDETIFHRIIKKFMIQGGGLTLALEKKKVKPPVPNEADNGLKNLRGTIAMARTRDPNSATAQFFINTVDNAFLDHKAKNMKGWGYCVFGKVIEGMNVVDKIENLQTANKGGRQNVPTTPVIIKHAEIEKLKENPKK
jgi:peptidyl-prolyl cis-trans isomerase B (cyclophilin B)